MRGYHIRPEVIADGINAVTIFIALLIVTVQVLAIIFIQKRRKEMSNNFEQFDMPEVFDVFESADYDYKHVVIGRRFNEQGVCIIECILVGSDGSGDTRMHIEEIPLQKLMEYYYKNGEVAQFDIVPKVAKAA